MIFKLKVDELKTYLRLRDLKVSGCKDELVARVFVVVENNVQPVLTAIEVEDDLRKAYMKKLNIDGKAIPDPVKIHGGWMEEDDGVVFWPMLSALDIYSYMFFPSELLQWVASTIAISQFVWECTLYNNR